MYISESLIESEGSVTAVLDRHRVGFRLRRCVRFLQGFLTRCSRNTVAVLVDPAVVVFVIAKEDARLELVEDVVVAQHAEVLVVRVFETEAQLNFAVCADYFYRPGVGGSDCGTFCSVVFCRFLADRDTPARMSESRPMGASTPSATWTFARRAQMACISD